MVPMVLSLSYEAPMAAKICLTERMYCSTLSLWRGLWLDAWTPVWSLLENIFRKGVGSLMPCRLVGVCNHVQKVSRCLLAVMSLRSQEVESPSMTDL